MKPKCVNVYIQYEVNLLRLGGFHILLEILLKSFKYKPVQNIKM